MELSVLSAMLPLHLLEKFLMILKKRKSKPQNNKLLCSVRDAFDGYNLISALHSYMSTKDDNFKNLLPPLVLLNSKKKGVNRQIK